MVPLTNSLKHAAACRSMPQHAAACRSEPKLSWGLLVLGGGSTLDSLRPEDGLAQAPRPCLTHVCVMALVFLVKSARRGGCGGMEGAGSRLNEWFLLIRVFGIVTHSCLG